MGVGGVRCAEWLVESWRAVWCGVKFWGGGAFVWMFVFLWGVSKIFLISWKKVGIFYLNRRTVGIFNVLYYLQRRTNVRIFNQKGGSEPLQKSKSVE